MAQNRPQVTYKGITPETQDAVRKAARTSGMTIGAWVEATLSISANNVRISQNNSEDTLLMRLIRLETMLKLLMEDYHNRHPEDRPPVTSMTHTGRIAVGSERQN